MTEAGFLRDPGWRGLIDVLHEGVSILDAEGRHLMVNRAFCEMLGVAEGDLIGVGPPHPYWSPLQADLDAIQSAFQETTGSAAAIGPFELKFQRKSGEVFPVEVRPTTLEHDGATFYIATIDDLSQRRRRDDARGGTLALLRSIVADGEMASWRWPLDGRPPSASDSYFTLLGYEPGAWDLSVEAFVERAHPDDIVAARESMKRLRSGAARVFEAPIRMRRAGDDWRWMLVRGYVTERDADGAPAVVTGTIQDVHRLRMQDRRVQDLQDDAKVGKVTSGLAHDINNILAVIYGDLDHLRDTATAEQREVVESLQTSSDRAAAVVASLLAHVRDAPPERPPVEIDAFIRATAPALRGDSGGGLLRRLCAPTQTASLDLRGLHEAIGNVVKNGAEAYGEGRGSVRVETMVETVDSARAKRHGVVPGRYVCVLVGDDGAGMAPEVVSRCTEPMFTTKAFGAVGLGLSVVKRFVDASLGILEIESREGRGTNVRLLFPALAADADDSGASSLDPAGGGSAMRVLVVDDQREILRTLQRLLRRQGHEATVTDSPHHALELLEEGAFDLLLTDIVMPFGLNGVELARRARALCPDIRLLFMTGYVREAEGEAARAMAPVLPKPFSRAQLEEALLAAQHGAVGVRGG